MIINKLFDLTGKTALITGGSSGLGEAIATALGLSGAKIAIAARRENQLSEALERLSNQGIAASSFVANLSDLEQSTDLAVRVLKQLDK